jgi:hypothetical protein
MQITSCTDPAIYEAEWQAASMAGPWQIAGV